MAIFAATDYSVTVAGTDFSDHVSSVELPVSVAELDTTNFGSSGWNEAIGGLKSATVSINFHQDFASAQVDSVLWSNLGSSVTIVLVPTSGSVSTTNPSFTFSAVVTDVKPIAATVGDLAVQSISWPVTGAITRATA